MLISNQLLFLSMIVLTIQSSNGFGGGCHKPLPDKPHPGHHSRVKVDYLDKNLGMIVQRSYIIQIPNTIDNTVRLSLVFDLHGWTGSAHDQIKESHWKKVALDNNFVIVWPDGMDDSASQSGSWNCSSTNGPLGAPCDVDRDNWGLVECYASCPMCDSHQSCDWTSCHDDIGYIDYLIHKIVGDYCIDRHQIHLTGVSNGGMFAWYLASVATDSLGLATINPVAASPLLGFGSPPSPDIDIPISIIDMHGTADDTIPYDYQASFGYGPHDSLISFDGYYYHDKQSLLKQWAQQMQCSEAEFDYATDYDGIDGFQCKERKDCKHNKGFVRCWGNYGHDYPLSNYPASAEVAWKFMKNHPRK